MDERVIAERVAKSVAAKGARDLYAIRDDLVDALEAAAKYVRDNVWISEDRVMDIQYGRDVGEKMQQIRALGKAVRAKEKELAAFARDVERQVEAILG